VIFLVKISCCTAFSVYQQPTAYRNIFLKCILKSLKSCNYSPPTKVRLYRNEQSKPKGSDTLESFLWKVTFESDFTKKSCTCVMKTFAIFLLSKENFRIRACSILESFFRKLLSKATFERKLSCVSLP